MTANQLPKLEDVIVAFQKSLSRARQNAQQVAQTPKFARGERALFVVEALDLDLLTGISMSSETPDVVLIDFSAPADVRSHIRFKVAAKPLPSDQEKG